MAKKIYFLSLAFFLFFTGAMFFGNLTPSEWAFAIGGFYYSAIVNIFAGTEWKK